MASLTAEPLAELQEQWTAATPANFLVVYRYALGLRLYLFENPAPALERLLLDCHNQFVNDGSRATYYIQAIPRDYSDKLIYDTADCKSSPNYDKPVNIILTGL